MWKADLPSHRPFARTYHKCKYTQAVFHKFPIRKWFPSLGHCFGYQKTHFVYCHRTLVCSFEETSFPDHILFQPVHSNVPHLTCETVKFSRVFCGIMSLDIVFLENGDLLLTYQTQYGSVMIDNKNIIGPRAFENRAFSINSPFLACNQWKDCTSYRMMLWPISFVFTVCALENTCLTWNFSFIFFIFTSSRLVEEQVKIFHMQVGGSDMNLYWAGLWTTGQYVGQPRFKGCLFYGSKQQTKAPSCSIMIEAAWVWLSG